MHKLTNADGDTVTITPNRKSVSVRTREAAGGTSDWTRYDTDDPSGRAAEVAQAYADEGYTET